MSNKTENEQQLTANNHKFLRVNAQIHNLDKQKTDACLQTVSVNFESLYA